MGFARVKKCAFFFFFFFTPRKQKHHAVYWKRLDSHKTPDGRKNKSTTFSFSAFSVYMCVDLVSKSDKNHSIWIKCKIQPLYSFFNPFSPAFRSESAHPWCCTTEQTVEPKQNTSSAYYIRT